MAQSITIDIPNILYDLLVVIANNNSISVNEYLTNIAVNWLKGQAYGVYKQRFDSLTDVELVSKFGKPSDLIKQQIANRHSSGN